jgi:hypothetical protein
VTSEVPTVLSRLTKKVNSVAPELPSAFEALRALMDTLGKSSLRMVPLAVPVPMAALFTGLRVTVKVSSGSTVVSPLTSTVMVLLVSPAAKVT